MLNKIFLQGRLVSDPELRRTPSGVAASSFRLAVERDCKDKASGQKQVDFINIVAWRQTGEFVSRCFAKGRMAIVEGRLQIRDYTDREGAKRTIAEVVAEKVYFGDSRKEGEGAPAPGGPGGAAGYDMGGGSSSDQFAELQDDDGELPFERGLCLPRKKAENKKMDAIVENMLRFHEAAGKAIREPDKAYTFVCPICGGEAYGGKAGSNNHIHVSCSSCGFSVMQ